MDHTKQSNGRQAILGLGGEQAKQRYTNGHDLWGDPFDEFMRSRYEPEMDADGDLMERAKAAKAARDARKASGGPSYEKAKNAKARGTKENTVIPKPWVRRTLIDVTERKLRWLHRPFIPMGKISLLAGPGGNGKGLINADRAGRVTRGDRWPYSNERAKKGRVLWVESEDDFDDTLKPRLMAAGVDERMVEVYEPRELPGWETIAHYIKRGDFQFVVLSPMVESLTFLSGAKNTNDDLAMRGAMQGLRSAVSGMDCALSRICHTSKEREVSVDAVQRILGSVAIPNLSRSAEGVRKEPRDKNEDPREPDLYRLGLLKFNLTKGGGDLLYHIESMEPDDPDSQRVRIVWHRAESDVDSAKFYDRPAAPKKISAGDWLVKFLKQGPKLRADVIAAGEEAGYKESALRQAYTRSDKFTGERSDFQGKSTWSLVE